MATIKLMDLIPPVGELKDLDKQQMKSIFGGMNKQELVAFDTSFNSINYNTIQLQDDSLKLY